MTKLVVRLGTRLLHMRAVSVPFKKRPKIAWVASVQNAMGYVRAKTIFYPITVEYYRGITCG